MVPSTGQIRSVLDLVLNALLDFRCSYYHLNVNIFPMSAIIFLFYHLLWPQPITVSAARFKAWICCLSLAGIVSSNPTGEHEYLSLVSVVCCQVEVSASGLSLIQRSPTECDVSECDRENSIMRRPWTTGGCCAMENKICSQYMSTFSSWYRISRRV